jgi:DNA-binding CsgD family transcriptional regulator
MDDSKAFPQRVLEGLSEAVKNIFHPSFYERTLREIGMRLGREVVSQVRQSHPAAPPFQREDYLRCLEWMKTHWGWNHDVKVETNGLVSISIPHCPFGKLAADDPHLCQIEAGMLGGIAGHHFNFAKVEICRGPDVPPKECSLTVHLERTPQSMIVEGPSFPLAPAEEKQVPTVGPEIEMFAQLTPREQQIVRLIGEGLSDKGIAGILKLSVRTAEGHIAKIREKTGLKSRSALIRWAIRINHDR